jgi:putative DNA primase/helicase
VVGSTRQDEPEFPPFETLQDTPGDEKVREHELFSKANVYAGENESSVTRVSTVTSDNTPENDAIEAAERAAIQAEGCEASEALPIGNTSPAMPGHKRTVATEALHYASVLGWKIFPLHTPIDDGVCSCGKADCQSIGKHPRTPRGLKDATNDLEQVKRWWRKWTDANIGIATGAASGLLVIDVDPRHGGWQGLEELFKRTGEVFPPTVEVITGSGGRHFFFRMPDADIRNSAGKLGAGLDVRANGGYVVAAGSVHASGNRYQWTNEELPLADVPYGVLKELIAKPRIVRGASNTTTTHKWTGGAISEGGRNETLFKRAAALRGQGADENAIIDALCDINNSCSPPLPLREIEKIAGSAIRYAPNARVIFA